MFAEVTTDTRIGTLLRMHHAAIHALGGVPRENLHGRMKTVVLGVDVRHDNRFHPLFADLSSYWNFSPTKLLSQGITTSLFEPKAEGWRSISYVRFTYSRYIRFGLSPPPPCLC